MAFTMHSHSGEFCGHAVDTLEEVVQHAVALGFQTIGLTEHMPRAHVEDLYPEEVKDVDPQEALAALAPRFDAYLREAVRLRDAYADRIAVLVGFETEWIRGDDDDGVRVRALAAHPAVDYFVGSLHHVGAAGTPIDYDRTMFLEAVAASLRKKTKDAGETAMGPATEAPFLHDYYDQQLAMLQALRPRVVGHMDLPRLLSAAPNAEPASFDPSGTLWAKIERNLDFVASYGGWLECNTAALRKGLATPYPGRAIAEAWVRRGGRFTLSDDSHGTAHVATNYRRGLAYLESLGVTEVWTLAREGLPGDRAAAGEGPPGQLVEKSVSLTEVAASLRLPEEGEEKE